MIQYLGRIFLQGLHSVSQILGLTFSSLIPRTPFYKAVWCHYLHHWGMGCIPLVGFTAIFTGMVLTLQTYQNFISWGGQHNTPSLVILALTRELCPVLTGLMIAGRAGSSLAAHLTSLRMSQQCDILQVYNISLKNYIFTPSIWSALLLGPCLVLGANIWSIGSSYLLWSLYFKESSALFLEETLATLHTSLWQYGLIKGSVFAFVVAMWAHVQGYMWSEPSSAGIQKSVTRTVVGASMGILALNYGLSAYFFT